MVGRSRLWLLVGTLVAVCGGSSAEVIDFDSPRWTIARGAVEEHLGRPSLRGAAYLEDVELGDGVIEVDMAVDGRRSFPGIAFRMRSEDDHELFYIRPHRPEAAHTLQYSPVFNGLTSWQLYSGRGFTAPAPIPTDRWFHIRIELLGSRARVYLDGAEEPALIVARLERGEGAGHLGLEGPVGGQAYFSSFSYHEDDSLDFGPQPIVVEAAGVIADWQLSKPLPVRRVDRSRSADAQGLSDLDWRAAAADSRGLVDISRHHRRAAGEPELVLARTNLRADRPGAKLLRFGYSDLVSVFLNGRLLFTGDSGFRSRDPEFMGIVGLHDAVPLALAEGDNELLLMVTESFGGWGFMTRLDELRGEAVQLDPRLAESWRIREGLQYPESVLHDPQRDWLYVSNLNPAGAGFVSRIGLDGRVDEIRWLSGLAAPTGMALAGGRLHVVERSGVVEIDPDSAEIVRRVPCPEPTFLNDIAFDAAGTGFVSDSGGDVVYRLREGRCERWLSGLPLDGPNGLVVDGDQLAIANLRGESLVFVALADGRVDRIIDLGDGMLDGLRPAGDGRYLVSHWEGRLQRLTLTGEVELLVDTTAGWANCADFEYIPERRLLVIPTYLAGEVVAYELSADTE